MKRSIAPYDILSLEQGSPEWLAARFDHVTASQMPVLFDLCPYQDRGELLTEKLTRKEREVNSFKQVLFERAHKAEAACREWVNAEWGIALSPAVLVSRKCEGLLASLDGFAPEQRIVFEAKYSGDKTLADVASGRIKPSHMLQVQTQLFVTGAEKCIYFMLSESGNAATMTIYPDPFYFLHIPPAVAAFISELRSAREAKR